MEVLIKTPARKLLAETDVGSYRAAGLSADQTGSSDTCVAGKLPSDCVLHLQLRLLSVVMWAESPDRWCECVCVCGGHL